MVVLDVVVLMVRMLVLSSVCLVAMISSMVIVKCLLCVRSSFFLLGFGVVEIFGWCENVYGMMISDMNGVVVMFIVMTFWFDVMLIVMVMVNSSCVDVFMNIRLL